MIRLHPDLRDPVLDGFTNSVTKPKAWGVRGKTLLLAGAALLSLGWGTSSIVFFVRRELSVPKAPPPVLGYERPAFGAKIDPEHFQQIRMGMKADEVEKLLGGPPGFYETLEGFQHVSPSEPRIRGKGRADGLTWYGRTSCITILLDGSDTVIDKEYCLGKRIP
jgi:hypothetical protein